MIQTLTSATLVQPFALKPNATVLRTYATISGHTRALSELFAPIFIPFA